MSDSTWISDWRKDLAAGTAGVQLVEVDHPLEIYVGATDSKQARIQVRSTIRPRIPSLSEIVHIDRTQSGDMWILSLTLQDARFNEVFVILAGHLVSRSRNHTTEQSAWRAIDDVLVEWQKLLRPRGSGVLSLEELRGLVGELWLVLNRFAAERSIETAVAGWLGPLGAPQDFWYEESGFHEAKSIGPSATTIKVNSAEQLDAQPLELVVLVVPQVAETAPGARNLVGLVHDVRDALDAVSLPPEELEVRLARLGVALEHPFYSETWFKVVALQTYQVGEDFPAIRASELRPGVSRVVYGVDRATLAPFLTATEEFD